MSVPNCNGNSIHECTECHEPYLCYNCPDELNASYSENICEDCLSRFVHGRRRTRQVGATAMLSYRID